MDPIYYQVNQSRLTEFSQKNTTDSLRTQHSKDLKKKAERAGELEAGMLDNDVRLMSDDMLGDMDPDEGSGGNAQQFAQMWRDQMNGEEQRRRQRPPQPEEEAAEEPAPPQDELAADPPETSPPADAPALSAEAQAAGQPLDRPTAPAARVPAPAAEEAEPAASPPAAPPEASARTAEPVRIPTGRSDESRSRSGKEAESAGDDQAELKGAPSAPTAERAARRERSEVSSLLDVSSGFLIAEEAAWTAGAEEEALPETAVAEEAALPEQLSALLERLVTGDAAHPSFRRLQTLLSRFGARVLQTCCESGVRVYLLPPGEPLGSHPQLEEELQGAAYLPDQRLVVVEDACVREAPTGFHPVFYYFAHAFDHALGGERFASLKSAAVQASFAVCDAGAHRFGDLMAAHSPIHYFAQAVESYLAENDCFEPLWTRSDLYDFDRSMHDYVEYLLRP